MKVNQTNIKPYKNTWSGKVKVIIACVLAILLVTVLGLIGYKTFKYQQETGNVISRHGDTVYVKANGYDSAYELAADFVTYTYEGNTEAIFKMQPECFQERSIEDNQMTYALDTSDVAGAVANLKRPLAKYIKTLNEQHGNWTETHEVLKDMYVYTDEELADLQQLLKMQGVDQTYVYEISSAGIVEVKVNLEASNDSGGYHHIMKVPVYKHGDWWYLGLRTGDVFLAAVKDEHDPYGDLLDGFTIVGEWDQYGNEVIYNDDGYRILTDEETGREYYEDIYGNKYYYNEEGYKTGTIVKIIGPDGGEPLTDETWEEYWNNYYMEQGISLYPDHQHDEYGNTQYLDEHGNVTETVGPDGGEPLTEDTYQAYWDEYGEHDYHGPDEDSDIDNENNTN